MYKLALRHRSQALELNNGARLSNERLEYLGDAILSAVTAEFLFKKFPYKDEGFLTEMRSRLVSRNQLNQLAMKLGINQLVLSSGEGSQFRSMSGDAFEALVGAIFLDTGYKHTRKVLIHRIIGRHIDLDAVQNTNHNYKSQLIEWAQRERKGVLFQTLDEVGQGYQKQYIVEVKINGDTIAQGRDFSIKGAEQNAAMKALDALETGGKQETALQ